LIETDQLLEYAKVYDHYYGTSKVWVEETLSKGQDVILEIDWQGARQVREIFPKNYVGIFILPPSREILESRLRERAQDKLQVIEKRLQQAHDDILHCDDFDYLVVNDKFEDAVEDILKIVDAEQLKTAKQRIVHKQLMQTL
jgi:guanylate kinase